jgi:outer membrane protein OmpA-like peptidoglycan-associated protein
MNRKFKRTLLATSIATIITSAGASEPVDNDVQNLDQINYSYNGDDTRLGIGITEEGEFIADFLKSFNTTYKSNWMAQAWYSDGAGGLELDYHWISTDSEQELIDNPLDYKIKKVFAAIDQNTWDDRKFTLGYGQEKEDKFWSLNLSKAVSGSRLASRNSEFFNDVLTGTIDGVDYIQDRTIETITSTFQHPYDWGVGGRFGKYFDNHLVRLTGGLDYEKGDYSSNQFTASVDLEKYFSNTGHSVALHVEQVEKEGDFEIDKSDTRAYLMYRYDFGKTFKPTERYEEVKVVDELALARLKEEYKEIIQNEIDLSSTAFFNLDSYELREDTKSVLNDLIAQIKSKKLASKINIVGHTCYIATHEYNQVLSENRANAARDYFVSQGVDAEIIMSSGKGETEPAYDNDGPEFEKNRRVAINFLTIESIVNDLQVPEEKVPVKWVKKPIKTAPSWLARALGNPAKHKKTVDVYQYQETETIETLGDIVFLNQAPTAIDDELTVDRNSTGVLIDVLNNDSDPDNDTLTVVDVSQPANGTVNNNGTSVTYTPNEGFIGTDVFEYTIDDGNGDQATAIVTINIENVGPQAVDDSATTNGTDPVSVDVVANDSDGDGTALIVKSVTQPENGTATNNEDGTVTYVANEGFVGSDTFTYIISDEDGAQSTASVTVIVEEPLVINNPPIAVDDMYPVAMMGTLTFSPLSNDSDPDGDEISLVTVDTSTLNGTLTVNSDGSMHYQAPQLFSGNDIFTYTITDPSGATATATVTLCVAD